jgi:hypothetical protein
MTRLPLILFAAASVSGCDQIGITGGSPTSDTDMRSVEIEVGTASDEMIILDSASGDGTAVDTSAAVGPAPPRPATSDDDADEAPAADRPERPDSGEDQVIRPPAGGAEPDSPPEPAKK